MKIIKNFCSSKSLELSHSRHIFCNYHTTVSQPAKQAQRFNLSSVYCLIATAIFFVLQYSQMISPKLAGSSWYILFFGWMTFLYMQEEEEKGGERKKKIVFAVEEENLESIHPVAQKYPKWRALELPLQP